MEINQNSDYIIRVTAAGGMIRAFFANSKNTANTAAAIHRTSPVMSAALGRLLTAGAIMGLTLKNDGDLLTLSIKGSGAGEGALVSADSKGRVKGYCGNPVADLPLKPNGKLDVSGAIGSGRLTVIKDTGFKEPYNGTVELQSGEIAEDIAYYFTQSEQTPSAVSLGVLVDTDYTVKQAGGFIIQLMPGASEKEISYLEQALSGLESLTNLYENGHTPESAAEKIFSGTDWEILEKTPIGWHCGCDRHRVEKALISIGKDELDDIIKEDKSASLNCRFCNKEYRFTETDLRSLLPRD